MIIDNASERAVLAGICQYGSDIFCDIDFIESQYFVNETNQILFKCLKEIIDNNEKIEYMSILSTAEKLGVFGLLSKNSEIQFIRSLFNLLIEKENIPKYAAKLAKLKIARDLSNQLKICDTKVSEVKGTESLDEIISIVETPINDILSSIYKNVENDPQSIDKELEERIEFLENNPIEFLGIPTGFSIFDKANGGGIRRKTVALIGAPTGVGKSVISTNVAIHVAQLGIPVLYLDTEMDLESQQYRILANLSSVKINTIAQGKFGQKPDEKYRIQQAIRQIKGMSIKHIPVAGMPFENILRIIKRWIVQTVGHDENGRINDCLVLYDYFKLMTSVGLSAALQEYQALGFQITQLSDFCIVNDVPCLAFVQLNRENAIAQSHRLEWLASTVAKFEPKGPEELAEDGPGAGNRKMTLIKARHGEGLDVGDYINLQMNGAYAQLEELHTRNMLKSGLTKNEKTFEQNKPREDLFNKSETE